MTNIFWELLNLAFEGSIVVLVVFLLRFILKKAPKRWIGLLWLVAIFRLLCPFVIAGPIPAFWEVNQELSTPSVHLNKTSTDLDMLGNTGIQNAEFPSDMETVAKDESSIDSNLPILGQVEKELLESQKAEEDVESNGIQPKETSVVAQPEKPYSILKQIWFYLAIGIWGAGSIYFLIFTIRNYMVVYRKLKKADKVAVFDGVEVRESDMTGLPASFGILRPAIYIPFGFSEWGEDKEYILWHERMHIRHRDSLKKILMYLVLCIHWWNPLVWLMVHTMNDDLEMACDEAVLAKLGEEKKTVYADTLVRFSMKQSGLEMPAFFGKSNTENRVKNVLKYHKLPVYAVVIGCVFVVCVGICLATKPHSIDKEQEAEKVENVPVVSESGDTIFYSQEAIDATYRQRWLEKLIQEEKIRDASEIIGVMHLKSVSEEKPETEYWHGDFSILTEDCRMETYRTELTLEHTENQYVLKEEKEYQLPVIDNSKKALEYGVINIYSTSEEKYGIELLADMLKNNSPENDKALLEPDTAAQFLMNLEGGEAQYLLQNIYTALVTYTFRDNTKVHYLMKKNPGCAVWDTVLMTEQRPEWYEGYEEALIHLQETLTQATAESLKENTDSGFVALAGIRDEDIVLYGIDDTDAASKRGMVLRVEDEVYPIYLDWQNMHSIPPKLYRGDFDRDGETEYAITMLNKTGTGTSGDALYVLELKDGNVTILEFAERDWLRQLQKQIQYKYLEDYNSLQIFDEDGVAMTSYPLREDSFKELVLGDIQSFECKDESWYLRVSGGVVSKEVGYPQYESGIEFLSTISYQDESFRLVKTTPNRKELPLQLNSDTNLQQKNIQSVLADVTHDGTPDFINLDIEQDQEEEGLSNQQLLNMGYVMFLRIYSGEMVYSSYQSDTCCIFERSLAKAHVGNGIYYLVHDKGKDYLMEISCALYQGVGDFFYKVFLLGNDGTKYVIEEKHQEVDLNDPGKVQPVEEMVEYTKSIQTWVDKGELLVLADVNTDVRIFGEEAATWNAWEIWNEVYEEIPELRDYRE